MHWSSEIWIPQLQKIPLCFSLPGRSIQCPDYLRQILNVMLLLLPSNQSKQLSPFTLELQRVPVCVYSFKPCKNVFGCSPVWRIALASLYVTIKGQAMELSFLSNFQSNVIFCSCLLCEMWLSVLFVSFKYNIWALHWRTTVVVFFFPHNLVSLFSCRLNLATCVRGKTAKPERDNESEGGEKDTSEILRKAEQRVSPCERKSVSVLLDDEGLRWKMAFYYSIKTTNTNGMQYNVRVYRHRVLNHDKDTHTGTKTQSTHYKHKW